MFKIAIVGRNAEGGKGALDVASNPERGKKLRTRRRSSASSYQKTGGTGGGTAQPGTCEKTSEETVFRNKIVTCGWGKKRSAPAGQNACPKKAGCPEKKASIDKGESPKKEEAWFGKGTAARKEGT